MGAPSKTLLAEFCRELFKDVTVLVLRIDLGAQRTEIELLPGWFRAVPTHVAGLATIVTFEGPRLLTLSVHVHRNRTILQRLGEVWGCPRELLPRRRRCHRRPSRHGNSPATLTDQASLPVPVNLY